MADIIPTTEETEVAEVTPTVGDSEVITLLQELRGIMTNMQQAMDKMAPVEQAAAEAVEEPGEEALLEEAPPAAEEAPEESVDDLDKLLQED